MSVSVNGIFLFPKQSLVTPPKIKKNWTECTSKHLGICHKPSAVSIALIASIMYSSTTAQEFQEGHGAVTHYGWPIVRVHAHSCSWGTCYPRDGVEWLAYVDIEVRGGVVGQVPICGGVVARFVNERGKVNEGGPIGHGAADLQSQNNCRAQDKEASRRHRSQDTCLPDRPWDIDPNPMWAHLLHKYKPNNSEK